MWGIQKLAFRGEGTGHLKDSSLQGSLVKLTRLTIRAVHSATKIDDALQDMSLA